MTKAWLDSEGSLYIGQDERRCDWVASTDGIDALREFFRAEEDERLGRWRWPKNPDYVVYRTNIATRVRVFRETGVGEAEWVDAGDGRPYEFVHAARSFFDAHPEPKPWHNAKPGEVWVLDANEFSGPHYVEDSDHFTGGRGFRHVVTRDRGPCILATYIKGANRIWPEES